jgi:hypothetical protein
MRPFTERDEWGTKQKKEYILDEQGEKIYDKNKRSYKCKSIPKDEIKEAEQIRKSVYSIVRQEQREQQPRRTHDHDR